MLYNIFNKTESYLNPSLIQFLYNGNCPLKKKFANFANLEAFVNVFLHFLSRPEFLYTRLPKSWKFSRELWQRREFAKLFFCGWFLLHGILCGQQGIWFCIPTSYTVPSENHKSFKVHSNSISEGAIFQKFLWVCPQTAPVVAYFACICALYTMNLCFTIKDLKHNHLVVKIMPLLCKSLDPPLIG